METTTLYESDFFEWTQDASAKIRERRFEDIDVAALAEEIEDLGKRDWKEVNSRIKTIVLHLLKLQFQPHKQVDSCSWRSSIVRERGELEEIFEQSPSLHRKGADDLGKTYRRAEKEAAAETGLDRSAFPDLCPYSYREILDEDFFGCEGE